MADLRLPDLKLSTDWKAQRMKWIRQAEACLYGHAPEDTSIRAEVVESLLLWDGAATRETVRIFYGAEFAYHFDAVIYIPCKPGKHPAITWNQFAHDAYDCCPYEEAVAQRGYIVARFDREQLVHDETPGTRAAYTAFPECDWGAIRVWAWAQSRLADYLLTRNDVDQDKLVCTGFSRGGKTALAAGIFDERFSICAPICAGAGGTGCFRYLGDRDGLCQDVTRVESMGRIGSVFPHWWTGAFAQWWPGPDPVQMGMEQEFPLDSHILKALIAPRDLITIDGIDDTWSNPWGTAVTWRASQPAFDLLGGRNEAYFRPGGHAFSDADWRALLDYCDEVYFGKNTGRDWDTCPFERT